MNAKKESSVMAPHSERNDDWRPDHAEVAHLAYCYYLDRGCEPGHQDQDWRRAEEQLRRRRVATSQAEPARTVIGVFHSMEQAQSAFDDLTAAGFSRDDISFIANKAGASDWTEPARSSEPEMIVAGDKTADVAGDAGIGAAIGGVGGLLLSFAGLAIPGVGAVLAAGPILAALGGAGLGAAAGGLIGVLTESGVPEEEAGHYAEGVRRGGILITVKARGERADRAAQILDERGAVDIDDRVSDWRTRGWTRHEAGAPPLTEDELRREREYFAAARRQGSNLTELTNAAAEATKAKSSRASRRKRKASGEPAHVNAPPVERQSAEARRAARIYGI